MTKAMKRTFLASDGRDFERLLHNSETGIINLFP